MQGINKVTILGTCVREPEFKEFSGGSLVNFTLVTNEKYKNKSGEQVENAEFHNIVAYGKQSEIINKYVAKGSKLYIEGKLKTRIWETNAGEKKYKTEIHLKEFQFLGGDKKSSVKTENKVMNFNNFDGDIPF